MFILLNILLNLQFKETKGLKSLQVKAEAYLESKHTFVMELFWIYLTAYYFCNKRSIIDIRLGSKWDKVFKNGPSKICGRQPLKNLKWYGLLWSP